MYANPAASRSWDEATVLIEQQKRAWRELGMDKRRAGEQDPKPRSGSRFL